MLDRSAILNMVNSGLIEFGAHTHNHVILTTADEADAKREILTSIESVEALTGKQCRYFAYPNGGKSDFSPIHQRILDDSGIEYSFSMISGLSSLNDDKSAIKRLFVSSNFSHSKFASVVHGY
jgi:peptidoglycan/xylan/chitin deacetylase (PgdA/CDA1 family)